jgi:predicted MFS family arabinose efflux permease
MAAGGLVFAPYPILALTARQRMTPDHLRGRVFAAYAAVVALGLPAGAALGAWMVTRGGVVAGVVGASTLSILLGLLAWWWPALRAVDPGAGWGSSGPSGG